MGYFWAFFMSSQIIGNVIAYVVLKSGTDESTLFVVFSILAIIGSLTFCFLKKPIKVDHKGNEIAEQEESI